MRFCTAASVARQQHVSRRYGTASLVARASVPPTAAPSRLTRRPGEVRKRKHPGHLEADALGCVAEQRHRRRPEDPEAHRREHGDDCEHGARAAARQHCGHDGGREQADRDRIAASAPVCEATHDRRSDASQAADMMKTALIPIGAKPRSERRSGTSTRQRPEEQRRQRDEPQPADDAPVVKMRVQSCRSGCASPRGGARVTSARPLRRRCASAPTAREDRAGAEHRGERTEHRAEQRAGDRDAEHRADHAGPRRSVGATRDQPREGGRPGAGARDALEEAGEVERDDRVGETEEHGRRRR